MQNIRRRLFRFFRPYRARFACALVAMVIYGSTDGVIPLIIRSILDDVFGKNNPEMLYRLPLLIILFAILRGTFGFLQNYLSASVGHSIVRDIRNAIHGHLLTLSPSFFEKTPSGTLISRVTNDTLVVRYALTDVLTTVLRESVRVISLLSAAIYLDPVLALFAFTAFPLGVIPVLKFGKKVRRLSRVGQDQFGGVTGVLQESIQGHKVVQSFVREAEEERKFCLENDKVTKTFVKAERYGALSAPVNELLASLTLSGVVLYGGLSVMKQVRTPGEFIAFITAMFLLYEPLKRLGRTNNTYQNALAAGERILEVLDTKPEIQDSPDAVQLERKSQKIEFRKVSFSYSSEQNQALKEIDLTIEPGEMIALVGMSGGGKSTFTQLLTRFYDPTAGEICIGGRNIKGYTLRSLREAIAVVSQHTFLFNDTALNNIRYGNLNSTHAEILDAAKKANALEFIENLPQGFETFVGEQGLKLSGGERARVAIARALLKDAPILVLDEATAALDSEAEAKIQESVDFLMNRRTVLVVAHRLSTVMKANRIAVFSHGKIIELGTHDELLRLGGEFGKLYQMQFASQTIRSVA